MLESSQFVYAVTIIIMATLASTKPAFSALAASSNMALNRSAVIMRFYFFSFPCRARLALRWAYSMPWYKCSITGENFPGILVGINGDVGFYTTRFVEAPSANEVEPLALSNLKNEAALTLPEGIAKPTNARVFFENIEQVDMSELPSQKPGLVFFIMGT